MTERQRIEAAFAAVRRDLGVRAGFPPEVEAEAERAAEAGWAEEGRIDLRPLPFATIDPPGSRDLDQALHIERAGERLRVHYAIADVACFVARGSALEAEAWLRGVTYYAPDHREPLYPPVLSQGAASLLPDADRPAIVFTLDLDPAGALTGVRVERAIVRSRAQLTYRQVREAVLDGGGLLEEPFGETLRLLRTVGELRLEEERRRGGVSLPILDQHVQEKAALDLGYLLVYEEPNVAEEWNAQISLLAGHASGLRMMEARVGLLRTSPPAAEREVEAVRTVARGLGFLWPDSVPYPDFIHGLTPDHPRLETLVWQARRLMRGADYVAFQGDPPARPEHSALAMVYSHCTAPLRRLADRYVLDLLVRLEEGGEPTQEEVDVLHRIPPVMDEAERRASRLERKVVDVAEAWTLRTRIGERFEALVLDVDGKELDVQLFDPPIRARASLPDINPEMGEGERVTVQLLAVEPEEGRVTLELAARSGAVAGAEGE